MNNQHKFILALALPLSVTPSHAQSQQLKAATISAGAARLDTGSLVNIGQPFVGVLSATDGVTLSAGILPVFGILPKPQPPAINPGVQMQGSVFQFSFQTLPGRNYVVESSTNLLSDDWLPIWTNTGSGTSLLFQDAQAGQHPWRFYRLLTP